MASSSEIQRGLLHYQYKDAAQKDIDGASRCYRSLDLGNEEYTFDTGQTSRLLCLNGTLPVSYISKNYNIPLAVYFVPSHPHSPPIVYVRPTPEMQIKPGRNVDANGRIYLPYLSNWKSPNSSTTQLLKILQDIFGNDPPVFAKKNASHPTPPKIGFNVNTTHGAVYGMPGTGWNSSGTPGALMPGLPGSTPSTANYYGSMPPMPLATTSSPSSNSASRDEEVLLSSLRSAILEKINQEQRDVCEKLQGEVQSLESVQNDLKSRRHVLETFQAQMVSELEQIKAATRELQEKTGEYKETYKCLKTESDGNIDYDSIVSTTTPVYLQLFEAFSKEQAIDDLFYYLPLALSKGTIDVDAFLQVIREKSRDQFMLRSTVGQCRTRAGLPPV